MRTLCALLLSLTFIGVASAEDTNPFTRFKEKVCELSKQTPARTEGQNVCEAAKALTGTDDAAVNAAILGYEAEDVAAPKHAKPHPTHLTGHDKAVWVKTCSALAKMTQRK
ncbi:MAG: hypothetical protein RLZZ324_1003 [Candidatus Parcubacteria bacterium]|jgi:hypothetical protein